MTRIYFVRHCEATGNAQRIFQGSTDCDISELGRKQLEFLSERFKDVQLDAVYSSPLKRARLTAEAIAKNKKISVTVNQDLRELHGGIVEGKPFMEGFKGQPELCDAWNNHPQDFAPEGGEHMKDAYSRICKVTAEIVKENKDKTIAITAHGGVFRCLFCYFFYGTIEKLAECPFVENTAVSLVEFDNNGNHCIKFFNDHSHVPDEYMPKRNRVVSRV